MCFKYVNIQKHDNNKAIIFLAISFVFKYYHLTLGFIVRVCVCVCVCVCARARACTYMHSHLTEIKEYCLCAFRFSEVWVIILLQYSGLYGWKAFKTTRQKSLNTLPLYKCSSMLIRYKIILKNFCLALCGQENNSSCLSLMHTLYQAMEMK